MVSGALNLSRQPHAGSTPASTSWAGSADFPAFVRVMRDVRFDLDWSVTTTVERVAPQSAAFTVAVPLMPGESVLSEGLEVRGEGVALVGLAAGQRQREWTSSLAHRDTLSLRFDAAPAVGARARRPRPRRAGGRAPWAPLPGRHAVGSGGRSQQGESPASSPDAGDLRAPSGNVPPSIPLPADRWPLMALGAGVGPA